MDDANDTLTDLELLEVHGGATAVGAGGRVHQVIDEWILLPPLPRSKPADPVTFDVSRPGVIRVDFTRLKRQ